jgi:hypothetical protein
LLESESVVVVVGVVGLGGSWSCGGGCGFGGGFGFLGLTYSKLELINSCTLL